MDVTVINQTPSVTFPPLPITCVMCHAAGVSSAAASLKLANRSRMIRDFARAVNETVKSSSHFKGGHVHGCEHGSTLTSVDFIKANIVL